VALASGALALLAGDTRADELLEHVIPRTLPANAVISLLVNGVAGAIDPRDDAAVTR
jgi:hypothetical protein